MDLVSRDRILHYTAGSDTEEKKIDRFPDGRPRVEDDILERMKAVNEDTACFEASKPGWGRQIWEPASGFCCDIWPHQGPRHRRLDHPMLFIYNVLRPETA